MHEGNLNKPRAELQEVFSIACKIFYNHHYKGAELSVSITGEEQKEATESSWNHSGSFIARAHWRSLRAAEVVAQPSEQHGPLIGARPVGDNDALGLRFNEPCGNLGPASRELDSPRSQFYSVAS